MVDQLVQVIGSLLVLFGFAAAQRGWLTQNSTVYLAVNAIGSAALAVVAVVERQWGFLLLEGVWALVSTAGLLTAYRKRRGQRTDAIDTVAARAIVGSAPEKTDERRGTQVDPTRDDYWLEPTRPHDHPFIPYRPPIPTPEEGLRRGREFYHHLDSRRSVRFFSDSPVPREMIELAVRAANTAPSGAHLQPWTFVATENASLKHEIRLAAEREERTFYHDRDVPAWHSALARLETDDNKEYLDIVPWIVVAFAQKSTPMPDNTMRKNYYVNESVGIACGLFISALHAMGLATLTHTPNPMNFLNTILDRPSNERPYILFPVGYPARDAEVPVLDRKPLDEALVIVR